MAGLFGGLSAHRLFMFPSESSGAPAAGFQHRVLELTGIPPPQGAPATLLPAPTVPGVSLQLQQLGSSTFASWERSAASGGEMLFKIAFVLLVVWLLGVLGAYPAGDLVHVLLLVSLMLLLLAFLRARDAALRRAVGGDPGKP